MSDEPSSRQEPRLKLKLRPDKSPDGAPPAIPTSPAAAPPPPPSPVAPTAPPPLPSAAGEPAAAPPSFKLKPRIAIKPTDPKPSGEGNLPVKAPPPAGAPFPATPAGAPAPTPAKLDTPTSLGEPKKLALPAIGAPTVRAAPPTTASTAGAVTEKAKPAPGSPVKPPESERPALVDLPPPMKGLDTDEKAGPGVRFKLKPKGFAAAASAASGSEAAPPMAPAPRSPGDAKPPGGAERPVPIPEVLSPTVGPGAPSAPKNVGSEKKPAPGKPGRLGLIIGLMGVLVLVVTGYFWYEQFVAGHPKEPPHPATVSKPPPPAPAAPVSAPAEARAAVEANQAAPVRETAQPSPAPKKHPPPAALDPSLQFRTFVDHLKVAVRIGPPTRLIVNDLTYRPGDVIDPKLGVVFVGVDTETKELIFEEPSGARIRRLF